MEPLYKDPPEMRTSPLIRTPCMHVWSQLYIEKCIKTSPEMRTPIAVSRVSEIEGFHGS